MNYRQKLYSKYLSSRLSYLGKELDLANLKRQFPVWNKYFIKHLPQDKEIKILEIGCGNAGFLYYLKTLGYKNYFGIDVSQEQIDQAKKLGISKVKIVDLREFLRGQRMIYDLVIARDVIEHFKKEEVMEILELVFGALKKKGKLIIQTPNFESPFGQRYGYGDFTHETGFTSASLSQVLRAVGFGDVKFYPTGPVVHGIRSAIRSVLWKMIDCLIRIYLLIETGNGQGIFTHNLIAVAEK